MYFVWASVTGCAEYLKFLHVSWCFTHACQSSMRVPNFPIHKSGSSFLLVLAALAISVFQVLHTYTLVTQICSQHLTGFVESHFEHKNFTQIQLLKCFQFVVILLNAHKILLILT